VTSYSKAKFIINDESDHKINQITTFANDKTYDITYPNTTRWFSDSTFHQY
jgi:hypothetical protein